MPLRPTNSNNSSKTSPPNSLQLPNLLKTELARRELAKRDFLEFIKFLRPDFLVGPFQEHLAAVLQNFIRAILLKQSPLIIIEAPPRHGKSIQTSEYLTPFLFLHNPRAQVIHVTYNQGLSDDFGRLVRRTLNSPVFQDIAPNAAPDPDTNAVARVDTIVGGAYSAVGMGGTISGKGADMLIIDDPVKNAEEAMSAKTLEEQWRWYLSVGRTRLMPGGGIVLVTTRWSHVDIAGRLIEQTRENPKADQFKRYSYPALCTDPDQDLLKRPHGQTLDPQRYPQESIERLRESLTAREWSALYQQNPIPDEGTFLSIKDVEKAITPLSKYPKTEDLTIYLPIDFAIGKKQANDWTVMWPMGVDADNNVWFLPDVIRRKETGHAIIELMLDLADRLNPREIIPEDGHLFKGLKDFIDRRMRERHNLHYLNPVWPSADKTVRAEPFRARLQQGKVFFPDIPLVREVFLQECASFGADAAAIHDDMVDAAAMGCARLTKLRGKAGPKTPAPSNIPEEFTKEWLDARSKTSRSRKTGFVRVPSRLNGRPR